MDSFGEHSFDAGFFVVSRDDDGHGNFGGEGERGKARGVGAGVWSCEGQFGGERRARRDIKVLENQEELTSVMKCYGNGELRGGRRERQCK